MSDQNKIIIILMHFFKNLVEGSLESYVLIVSFGSFSRLSHSALVII